MQPCDPFAVPGVDTGKCTLHAGLRGWGVVGAAVQARLPADTRPSRTARLTANRALDKQLL